MQGTISDGTLHNADRYRAAFADARPFRHVLMESFLTSGFLESILAQFPEANPSEMTNEFGGRSLKHAVSDIRGLGPAYRAWDAVLRSDEFIAFLEHVTGIPDLLYDPGYFGAGTHNNLHGQSLDLHVDFNRHPETDYHRRLNLIVYLCEEWQEDWGGSIELHRDAWDRSRDREFVSYPPYANNAVLFETHEHSWHGFAPINLPEERRHLSRKSLTVYYYTRQLESGRAAGTHSTVYVPGWIPDSVRPGEPLSEEAFAELEAMLHRRDHFLRGLYRSHHRQVEDYHRVLRKLRPLYVLARRLGLLDIAKKLLK
ncbi:MAG: 2OG-Fe(II) oxygenase [Pseudomonadota bacterium]